MSGSTAVARPAERGRTADIVGLVAFAAAPAVALYQGVVEALGVLVPLSTPTATLVPLIVIAVCLVLRILSRSRMLASPSMRRATLYFFAYLLVIMGSTLLVNLDPIERDPAKMTQQFFLMAGAALVFMVMVSAPSLPAATRALRVSLIVWAVAAIITPLTALTPLPIGELQGEYVGSLGLRSFGVLGDGGTFVVSFLAVAFFGARKFVWFALAMLALIFAGSRVPLVIAAAGLAATFVLATPGGANQSTRGRAMRVVAAALAAALALVAIQIAFGVISAKIGALNAFERLNETQFTDSDRFFSIMQGIEWFQLSPFYGNGFNSYYYFSLRSAAFGANQSTSLNQIVQTLVDGGVLGLIFLVLFFFEILRPGRAPLVDRRHDPFSVRVWLLAFLVLNQTAVYILPAFYLTILIFGLCGIALHAREAAASAAVAGIARTRPAPPLPAR